MARIKREATVVLFDIGHSSVDQLYASGGSYFENARSCLSMFLQRKLFINKNDVVGLFLLGTEETNNPLHYSNISLQFNLDPVSWEVLEFVEKEMKPTTCSSDWLSAIVVGMHYLRHETEDQPMIIGKKLILFSSFATAVDEHQVNMIVNGLKTLEIELVIIGPKLLKTEDNEPASERFVGERLILDIVDKVGGVITSFDEAVAQLQFIEAKKVKPTPWNALMDVGPDIKIRVAAFKKVSAVQLPSWKISSNRDGGPAIAYERNYVKQDVDQTPVNKDDVIPGYRFGSSIVPFADVDDSTLSYDSGKKCLSILGFTEASRIPRNVLVGDGAYCVVAQANDPNASVALSALIGALHEKNMVAVARKVYRDGSAPTIGVLIPKIRPKYECLLYIDLPFSEDVRTFVFPSLDKTGKPSEQQLEAVDGLIDNMDLMGAGFDEVGGAAEAFHTKRNVDPYHQHFYAVLCERGLNPDKPLPPVKESTLKLLESPCWELPGFRQALGSLKDSFPLVRVPQKEPRKAARDIFKQDDADPAPSTAAPPPAAAGAARNGTSLAEIAAAPVTQIGTVNPVKDFQTVMQGGRPFQAAAEQLAEVILSLVLRSFGDDDFGKAAAAMKALRESCVAKDAAPVYNGWLRGFKERILGRGKEAFWDIVAKDQLGLVSQEENKSSNVDADAAAQFLVVLEEKAADKELDQDMDIEDLLN